MIITIIDSYEWLISTVAILLIYICYTDIRWNIIPNLIIYPLIAVTILYVYLFTSYFTSSLLGGVVALAVFISPCLTIDINKVSFGDVKLSFLMGLLSGYPLIIYIIGLASCLALVVIVISRINLERNLAIPFAPFLVLSLFLIYTLELFNLL